MFIKFSVSSCPVSDPRYKILDNHCFYFEKNKLNFTSANENCQEKLGAFGRLYEPNSIEEMKKVSKLGDDLFKFQTKYASWAWIGVTDKRIEGQFVYHSSGLPIKFSPKWSTLGSTPYGSRGRKLFNCVIMWIKNDTFFRGTHYDNQLSKWADTYCDSRPLRSSICRSIMYKL